MNYTIRFSRAMLGDVVPLVRVAEEMARHKATGHGHLPLNANSLKRVKPEFESMLSIAATNGALVVCDQFGSVKTIKAIVSADLMAKQNPQLPAIYSLYAKEYHLNLWGSAKGDTFNFSDIGVEVVRLGDELEFMFEPAQFQRNEIATLGHAGAVGAFTEQALASDPERRLHLLRALGGSAKYARGEWKFTGVATLAKSEKAEGRKRYSEKTIRKDLEEAAQEERDAKSAGFATGLGQR